MSYWLKIYCSLCVCVFF